MSGDVQAVPGVCRMVLGTSLRLAGCWDGAGRARGHPSTGLVVLPHHRARLAAKDKEGRQCPAVSTHLQLRNRWGCICRGEHNALAATQAVLHRGPYHLHEELRGNNIF